MADTRQVVSWSLERKCRFREGDQWFLPGRAFQQLFVLRTVARAYADSRVVDGICVTCWSTEQDNSGQSHAIPHDGFRIEERLGKFGGLQAAGDTCQSCEANADSGLATRVAGCFGDLDVWPDSPELDEQLWRIIEERSLEGRLRSAFPVTTPLWYGFWIESPLRRLQAELLYELLDAACDRDDPQDNDIVHFLNALKAAINWELPVHVSLAPLGHTDFGWYTVFPHCPRCKANARVGRWKQQYSTVPYECQVCGHAFIPNEHHSMEQDEIDWEADSLQEQLGERGYEEFTRRFLLYQGCTEKQAEETLDNKNHGPVLRQIAAIRKRREATRRKLKQERRAVPQEDKLPRTIAFALTDDIDLEIVLVPAGEFLMGSSGPDDHPNESPQHTVRIERPFYIGRFPITQAQWRAVMGTKASRFEGQDLPVDQVSWFDCQEFCERLSARQKRFFRLPTEAEWEYACRAGTTTKYAFGETLSAEQANFTPFVEHFGPPPKDELELTQGLELAAEASEDHRADRSAKPTPVGSYPPNGWGIYDMHGNVEEWCEDVWHDNYEGAPSDGSAWLEGENKQPFRVLRGGWCSATEFVCTSASRRQVRADAGSLDEGADDDGDDDGLLREILEMTYMPVGFRVVCDVSAYAGD